jgi:hypothetical protein
MFGRGSRTAQQTHRDPPQPFSELILSGHTVAHRAKRTGHGGLRSLRSSRAVIHSCDDDCSPDAMAWRRPLRRRCRLRVSDGWWLSTDATLNPMAEVALTYRTIGSSE